jgi:hypothetical protein
MASCSSPSDDIDGAAGGRVEGLVVRHEGFDRWFVPQVQGVRATRDGRSVALVYYAARCDRSGLVGTAIQESKRSVRVTVVAGQSGSRCDTAAVPHDAKVRLHSPLGSRRVVVTEPQRD